MRRVKTQTSHLQNTSEDGTEHLVSKTYAVRTTAHLETLMAAEPEGANGPVSRQYQPRREELLTLPEENPDPIGDNEHSPVPGIVHRYPDRVLLKIANVCAVYCRYCFRRSMIGPKSQHLSAGQKRDALAYIASKPEIWEVILTGGDPLVLSARQIAELLEELGAISHVKIIRIHTRIPVADPQRVTDALCAAIKASAIPVYIALHVNHAREITPAVERAVEMLRGSGCMLLSQSVLLRGVNDSAGALEALFRRLVELHIKPYYLHHPDYAPGTSHFRVPLEEGRAIMAQLQGRISGLCMPHYMLDIPGGHGKIPVHPCFIETDDGAGCYTIRDPSGKTHAYPPLAAKSQK